MAAVRRYHGWLFLCDKKWKQGRTIPKKRVVIYEGLCTFKYARYYLNEKVDKTHWYKPYKVRKRKKLPDFFICRFLSNFRDRHLEVQNLLQLIISKTRRITGY